MDLKKINSPSYVIEEKLLENNLKLIKKIIDKAEVDIILAFKGFAMWKMFPLMKEYINSATSSSLNEARLAFEEMGSYAHTYSPAYKEDEFDEIMNYSSHITFNSLSQYSLFHKKIINNDRKISIGLRVNHEFSEVETDLYNPCALGSRLGITSDQLQELPEDVEGLHFHSLCESSSYDLEKTLVHFEAKFGKFISKLKWVNFGGGHLITRKDYDVDHLIKVLKAFKSRYPNVKVILEPGSAFAWETGVLVSSVVDIVHNHGVYTAIMDVSFAAHMPDCLEMPYFPRIRDAKHAESSGIGYRIGGNSCLAGDYMGIWEFEAPLKVGDKLIFEDMIHYTMVKTSMFNGLSHPSIGVIRKDGSYECFREFDYMDYKNRLS
ncbi:MAG: carboxynorspermidine decarboxylase [Hyphomicrobiales bacterium]